MGKQTRGGPYREAVRLFCCSDFGKPTKHIETIGLLVAIIVPSFFISGRAFHPRLSDVP
jgi:hypothetical protein